jgi:hypothetical protein
MLNTSRLRYLEISLPALRLLNALVDQGNENARRKIHGKDYARNFEYLDLGYALSCTCLSGLEVIVAWQELLENGYIRKEDELNYLDVTVCYWALYCSISSAWKDRLDAKRLRELSRQNALNALPIFDRLTLTPEGIIFQ